MPSPSTIARILPMLLLLLASCGDEEKPVNALACYQNSDCKDGLVCTLGRCRLPCKASKDCGGGGSCITDGVEAVCQSLEEKNTPCDFQKDCLRPLSCASDYRCRNMCTDDDDCNVFGIKGRRCARDMRGKHYCAEPKEVRQGLLVSTPPEDATGDYTPWPDASFSAPEEDASIDGGDTDASPDDGGEGDALDPDVSVPKTCDPGCPQSKTCVDGDCVLCGSAGEACCDGTSCGTDLTCTDDEVCSCGGANQACCGGDGCEQGLSCDVSDDANPVCACGALGTSCCPGEENDEPVCEGDGVCAGSKCSCIAEFASGWYPQAAFPAEVLVRRTDGSVWRSGQDTASAFEEVRTQSGARLQARAVAVTDTRSLSAQQVGCALTESGEVLCFPSAALTDSTWLGAGLAATETTSFPVKVASDSQGTPLSGVTQLAASEFAVIASGHPYGPTFCAVVNAPGEVWCWGFGGFGQLGRGGTTHSNYARPVLSDDTTPFSGAVEVQLGHNVACARKTDGSVWCWGTNLYGELGVPPGTMASSYHPVRVALTGTVDQTTATNLKSAFAYTVCAVMKDTSAVCWGSNTYGESGSDAIGDAPALPTTIQSAADGPTLTGILDLAHHWGRTCARLANLDVVCWGGGNPYPAPLEDRAGNAVAGIGTSLVGGSLGIGYVDAVGLLSIGSGLTNGDEWAKPAPLANQPPCVDP